MKVSVIIPVYNVENYIEDCINSVLHQTEKDIEVICIDDASTDQSLALMRKLSLQDARIKVLQNAKNKGLSYTRNFGLKAASGEYIYFLDSDDMIEREALLELYSYAKTKKLDLILFDAKLIFESQYLKDKFYSYKNQYQGEYREIESGKHIFLDIIKNKDSSSSVPRQVWRRKYLIENNLYFFEGILHEDELFSFAAILQSQRTAVLKKQYFIRRFRKGSIMSSLPTEKNLFGMFTVYYEALKILAKSSERDSELKEAEKKFLTSMLNGAKKVYSKVDSGKIQNASFSNVAEEYLFELLISEKWGEKENDKKYACLTEKEIDILKAHSKVFIYGAGRVGSEVLQILDHSDVKIEGFIVTNKQVNRSSIMGHPVIEMDDIVIDGDTIVIVAVVKKYQREIVESLIKKKCRYLLGVKNEGA